MNAYQEFRMMSSRPVRPDGKLDKVTAARVMVRTSICRASSMVTWSEALMHMR